MGGIDVSADNHVLATLASLLSVFQESVVEVHLVLETLRRAFAVREIDIEQHEITKVGDYCASFGIEPVPKSILNTLRRFLGVETHTAVTLLLRG